MAGWLEIRPIEKAGRQAETAAWQAIVRERLGNVEVKYNENGAPVLARSSGGYISVSHTRGWVAVVYSDSPCAVDIELKSRTISSAVATRMNIEPDVAAWCAFEARYKYRSVEPSEPVPPVSFHPHPELVVAIICQ